MMFLYYGKQDFDNAIIYADKGRQQSNLDGLDSSHNRGSDTCHICYTDFNKYDPYAPAKCS